MSMLHFNAECLFRLLRLHTHAVCSCRIFHAACSCCMFMNVTCSWMPHVHMTVACACRMWMPHLHAACPCCINTVYFVSQPIKGRVHTARRTKRCDSMNSQRKFEKTGSFFPFCNAKEPGWKATIWRGNALHSTCRALLICIATPAFLDSPVAGIRFMRTTRWLHNNTVLQNCVQRHILNRIPFNWYTVVFDPP